MTTITLPQRYVKAVGEKVPVSMDLQDILQSSETITGTPTVADDASVLTIGNIAVNAAAMTVLGRSVAIGKAITYTVAGGVAGVAYRITVTCNTSGTGTPIRIRGCRIDVVANTA